MYPYPYPRLLRSYRRGRITPRDVAIPAGVAVVLAALVSHGTAHAGSEKTSSNGSESHAAAVAIAYARHQLGCPYVYGGTGPCSAGFDCSGLVMDAWAAAHVYIPRTSEEQWAGLPHVSQPQPGDLVLAPGSPIDPPPGHVGMYIGHGQVIQAYATGTPVEISSLSSFATHAGGITGYVRP